VLICDCLNYNIFVLSGDFMAGKIQKTVVGQVNGVDIEQRSADGFINATAMCAAHGKDINDWFTTNDTFELFLALAADLDPNFNSGILRNLDISKLSEANNNMDNTTKIDLPESIAKELHCDQDGKGFISRRGLARLCGVSHQSWGRGGSMITQSVDEYLTECGTAIEKAAACNKSSGKIWIPDTAAALVIAYYAQQGNEIAAKLLISFAAFGLRVAIQKSTGYKSESVRKPTAQEIVEIFCLAVPSPWERRFPEEYYEHLSRLTGLTLFGTAKPGYWAALTKELIYDYLPAPVYAEIKRRKELSGSWAKLHQYLEQTEGIELLRQQQQRVLHHMQGASSLDQLRTALQQACTGQYQLLLFGDK
jgi:hypothetical protein